MVSVILWIFLPASWDLGNVRAILALIINFLCVIGIWVVAYSIWKVGAMKLDRSHKSCTKILSLYCPTGLGEVLEIIPLLRASLGIGLLAQLLIPGAIIVILSTVAIMSAPIARYSTRVGMQIAPTLVPGTLATTSHRSIDDALVKWNETIERFNLAGLPLNQLMDFLPDNTIDWKYSEPEWNNSWSASCRWTERTPIKLYAMGNASSGGRIWDIFPGISAVFPGDIFEAKYARGVVAPGPYRGELFLDKLLFISMQTNPNVSFDTEPGSSTNFGPFHFTIAAFHLKNTPANFTDDGSVTWGTGPVEQSWYTMASCDLDRVATQAPDKLVGYDATTD